jgi:hypothetical protein
MPQEFTSVTASSYDAAGLATKLTDKSAEGWEVVGIVTSGTEIAAFLKREATGASTAAASSSSAAADPSSSSTPTYTAAATTAASEPAGWGTSPTSSSTSAAASTPVTASAAADPSSGYSAASQPSTATAAASTPASSVPAGWYADPAGRFDLRYWDGNTWTEHVSRAGQQFTDPPVA